MPSDPPDAPYNPPSAPRDDAQQQAFTSDLLTSAASDRPATPKHDDIVREIERLRTSDGGAAEGRRRVINMCPTELPSVYAERLWYAWKTGGRLLLADCMIQICECHPTSRYKFGCPFAHYTTANEIFPEASHPMKAHPEDPDSLDIVHRALRVTIEWSTQFIEASIQGRIPRKSRQSPKYPDTTDYETTETFGHNQQEIPPNCLDKYEVVKSDGSKTDTETPDFYGHFLTQGKRVPVTLRQAERIIRAFTIYHEDLHAGDSNEPYRMRRASQNERHGALIRRMDRDFCRRSGNNRPCLESGRPTDSVREMCSNTEQLQLARVISNRVMQGIQRQIQRYRHLPRYEDMPMEFTIGNEIGYTNGLERRRNQHMYGQSSVNALQVVISAARVSFPDADIVPRFFHLFTATNLNSVALVGHMITLINGGYIAQGGLNGVPGGRSVSSAENVPGKFWRNRKYDMELFNLRRKRADETTNQVQKLVSERQIWQDYTHWHAEAASVAAREEQVKVQLADADAAFEEANTKACESLEQLEQDLRRKAAHLEALADRLDIVTKFSEVLDNALNEEYGMVVGEEARDDDDDDDDLDDLDDDGDAEEAMESLVRAAEPEESMEL